MNRRTFLQCASLLAGGNLVGFGPFGAMSSLAQSSNPGDYKALVCIFLYGGNDANNVLVPTDNTNYGLYSQGRGALALAQAKLLPLTGTKFGVHPSMTEVASLFQTNKLAVVANVGTLVAPVTAAQIKARAKIALPAGIASHAAQQNIWQSVTQGSSVNEGWAGKVADKLDSSYGSSSFPMCISTAGVPLLLSGNSTYPFTVASGATGSVACGEGALCSGRLQAAQQLLTFSTGAALVDADSSLMNRSYTYNNRYIQATAAASKLQTVFPNNSLAAQLSQIATIMQVRSQLGPQRQIFFASLGGFDTHTNELATQASLLTVLSQSLAAFESALEEMGIGNQVTTFTGSDFARTLQPNATAGTDHAWGSHHMVMGGAVKGGQIYGTFPSLQTGGRDDYGTTGQWVPTTSVAQYAATLASWFGVADADLASIFSVLPNFSNPNLGFV